MQFCLTLTLLALGGLWADGRWGTTPWLTIAGSLLGMTAATYLLIRQVGR